VVDKVALRQVFSSTSVSPANFHSTNFSTITITYHLGLVQQASSGRSTKRLGLTPLRIKKKDNIKTNIKGKGANVWNV
jgi:hypothetical protein